MSLSKTLSPDGEQEKLTTGSEPTSTPSTDTYSDAKTRDWSEASEAEQLSAIGDLLADTPPAEPQPNEVGEDPDPWVQPKAEAVKPGTLGDMAKQLGISPEEAYNLTIPTGDGEAVKLGDLKDAWQSRQAEARETAKRAEALDQRESAAIASEQFLVTFAEDLAKSMPPQAMQGLVQQHQQRLHTEQVRLLQAMPELKDPETLDRFHGQMVETLGRYGIGEDSPALNDHRVVLMVRDLMRSKARLDKLLAFEPEKAPPRQAKTRPNDGEGTRRAQMMTRAKTGSTEDKVAAINTLLKG